MLFLDFYYFYATGHLLHQGGSPYNFESYIRALYEVGYPIHKGAVPYPYPPTSFWLVFVLASLPFTLSLLMNLVLGVVSICLTVGSLRFSDQSFSTLTGRFKLLALALIFPPVLKMILFGQIAWINMISMHFFIRLLSVKRGLMAGVLLSLTLIKPHLFLVVYGALAGGFLKGWARQIVVGLIIGVLVQFLIGTIIVPDVPEVLSSYSPITPHGEQGAFIISSSLVDQGAFLVGVPHLRSIVALVGVLVGVIVGLRSTEQSFKQALWLRLIPISLLFAPYAWAHDYILLLPLILFYFERLCTAGRERVALFLWMGTSVALIFLLSFNLEVAFSLLLLLSLIPIILGVSTRVVSRDGAIKINASEGDK